MSGCVLRVVGSKLKIKKFLASSKFNPLKVYYKGDPGFPKSRGPSKVSGFNLSITSDRVGSSIEDQSANAVSFLKKNRSEFQKIKSSGFQLVTLDFALYDKSTKEHPWPTYRLSPQLIAIAGKYGCGIEISFYGSAR